ncbi:MAG: co-chaperone GroES [Candidatus Woesearchaeota archaeon]|nr:MAG: co-chaperone GroES [Candidatus Woesearchaeota archaeon]
MNVQPLGTKLLIKPVQREEKTAGGIYLPPGDKEESNQGIVVAIGDKVELKVGDKVIYGGYSNTEIDIDGKTHLIIDQKEVVAKIL